MKKKDTRAGQTIEALVTPELKKEFAYYCKVNNIPMNELAGEAIQLILDFKKNDFGKLEKIADSPVLAAINNMQEQQELIIKLLMQNNQKSNAIAKTLAYGGQLPESGSGN